MRRRSSSQLWPEHGLKKCLWSCKVELRPHGCGWSAILACTARAFSLSLLDSRPVGGSGDVVPSVHEVLREARFFLSTEVFQLTFDHEFSHILQKKKTMNKY